MSRQLPARPDGSSDFSPGDTMSSSFTYGSPLDRQSIRLLEFEQSSTLDEVCCRLVTTCLADAEYVALSYAWGEPTPTRRIICNGKPLYIAENLYGALNHFSQHPLRAPLWCDAISINQADNDEKAIQVRMMGKIYAHAKEVIIWLGEEHETDRQALK